MTQLVPLGQKEELEKQKIPESATGQQSVKKKTLKRGKRSGGDGQTDRQDEEKMASRH